MEQGTADSEIFEKHMFDGSFGLERETLRVTADGSLARTSHPFGDNKYLDRDFCENQLELITPVCSDTSSLIEVLCEMDREVKRALAKSGEYLWMSSNPPHIGKEDEIMIADFRGKQAFKRDYRVKLESRYGKKTMLYCGIHFNFSFSDKLISSLYDDKTVKNDDGTPNYGYKSFKNSLYFRLSKQVFRYAWLLVMLTAASPVYDSSLDGDGLSGTAFDGYSSMRGGERGYWNKFIPILDYTDLDSYINSVSRYVDSGMLFNAGELYLPVRLKPHTGSDLSALTRHGVNHIELRMFDVNPLSPVGIFREDLEFAHYFLIYLLMLPDFEFTPVLQEAAINNYKAAARYDLSEIKINGYHARDAAIGMLDDMSKYFSGYSRALKIIEIQKEKIIKNERYCVKVYERLSEGFQEGMTAITMEYAARAARGK